MAHLTNISVGNIKNFDIKSEEGRTIISFDSNPVDWTQYVHKPRTIICKVIKESIENRITFCKLDLAANLGNIVGNEEHCIYYEEVDDKGHRTLRHYSHPAMHAMESILDKVSEMPEYQAVDVHIFSKEELTQLIKAIVPNITVSNGKKVEYIEMLTDELNFKHITPNGEQFTH